MWTLYPFAAILLIAACKGYTDATWGDQKVHPGTPWDRWHVVGRFGLTVACCWPLAYALGAPLPPWWYPGPGALVGIVGFWVGKRLGGQTWKSMWIPWLR